MLPVIKARLMIACAARVASCPWLTPIVHQNETRFHAFPLVNPFRYQPELRHRDTREGSDVRQ
jgi:hypothetical protein